VPGGKNANRPNILWLMTDEQRTDSLGCYGSSWAATPGLDGLAAEGVLFRHAITPAPVCAPARLSLLTGLYPHQTGVWWNKRRSGRVFRYLTAVFEQAGYRTASFGKQHYCGNNRAFQVEEPLVLSGAVDYFRYVAPYDASDFDVVQYPGQPYPWIFGGRFPGSAEQTSEARAVRRALEWLEDLPPSSPFLLRVSFNAPHTPVVVPPGFERAVKPDEILLPRTTETLSPGAPLWIRRDLRPFADGSLMTEEQVAKMRGYYYSLVSFCDHQFRVLLARMDEMGLLDNTVVVFVSDHGTHLGDYGLVQKQTFYEPVVNVPFIFWCPGLFASGAQIETPVETISLLPTLLDIAGLPLPPGLGAHSLAATLTSGCLPPQKPVFSEFTLGSFDLRCHDRLVMVREGNSKLIISLDDEETDLSLYDLTDDPYERVNLAADPRASGTVDRLRRYVDHHLAGGEGRRSGG